MMDPVALYRAAVTKVPVGGEPVVVMDGPIVGGFIANPMRAEDQGLLVPEVLFVDIVGPAALQETETTVPIQPGQFYIVPPGLTGNVSVNAASSGHKFSAVVYQPPTPYPPTPQPGNFPPAGPTTLTEVLPAYLYQEYADDDALQAFVTSYNALAQNYIDWFAGISLPVYTGPQITGSLLDWVAAGLYGMRRPSLSSGRNRDIGPLNTFAPNTLGPNMRKRVGPSDVTATSDDVFKRIMTWNFYKGDGYVFSVRWLKRRIMRFLIGENGAAPNVGETYAISVTYGNGKVAIRITVGTRSILGGALPNRIRCNQFAPNRLITLANPATSNFPLGATFKQALESGAIQLPFQYEFSVAV